ncbi:MAG TPA: PAS domain S-box protein [Stellaceae bacterium]|nr:PAS domain S-box protein [Stellaceae bacterium]
MILGSAFPMAVRWGPELVTIYNDAYAATLGDKHPAAFGKPLAEIWPEINGDLGPLSSTILRGERAGFFAENQVWRVRRHGDQLEEGCFTCSYSPIPDKTAPNGIGGVLVAAIETTGEHHTQAAFRSHNSSLTSEVSQRLQERDQIWRVSEDLLVVANFDGYFTSVNPAWTALLGWSEEEIKRLHVSELRHPDDAPQSEAARAQLKAGAPTVRVENRLRHKDGSWRWIAWTMSRDGDRLIYAVGRDITAQKQAAVALREKELHLKLLIDAVVDYAIYMLDPDGIITSWNSGAERIKGYRADEIIGKHFSAFYTSEDRAAEVPQRALAQAASGVPWEAEGWRVRKDSTRFWASVALNAVRDDQGKLVGFAKITRDITAQKEAAEALRESELHFRLLVDGVVDYAIYMLDPRGIVSSWNSGAERIKGYKASEIIGRHFSTFYTPEDRAARIPERAMARAASGCTFEAEGWRVRKDGSPFWASVALSAIRDENGQLIGFAKVTRDITERRESQEGLRRAQERLAQSQKLEILGQLTGAIAHDFNNLLMVIGANTQLVKRRLVDPPSLRAVDAVEHAASRGETLTRRLLIFSRRQALDPIVIDTRDRLAASREILATSAGEQIELVFDLPEPVWPVFVDVPELELALVNIVVNARDAMPDGGTIRISAGNERISLEDALDDLSGDFVALRVTDTGPGIEPDVLARVFEPFFTTKGPEKGTGLGLSQVYGFARLSNGTVQVTTGYGTPAGGTTVTIYLPRANGTVVRPTGQPRAEERQGRAERILLVEDNHEVQQVTAAFLEELGYAVTVADNADAALDRLASEPGIRLVFSDIMMPGAMNGVALARHIRNAHPDVAVLLTTGFTPQQELLDETLAVLRKPYRLATLSAALRGALERARTPDRAARPAEMADD